MKIEQFEDKYLSHFSYAILDEQDRNVILIDPSRDTGPYYRFAREHDARITAVIETHSHADFVSSHLEFAKAGAAVYVSKDMPAQYVHSSFDEGNSINTSEFTLKAINTPGHSNDSISVILEAEGKDIAIFTGDTLFIGDVGRPDLRETQKNAAVLREDLARKMYHSLRNKILPLADDVIVYPAHGAGSLCGKSLSKANSSTIGRERISNWALQESSENDFIEKLTSSQPFIPAYFPYDVETNLEGAPSFSESVAAVPRTDSVPPIVSSELWIVDSRPEGIFKKGHLPHSVNIMEGEKFETWLGAIIRPQERFLLAGENEEQLDRLIKRAASIGYEKLIEKAFLLKEGPVSTAPLNIEDFKKNKDHYTIVDIRNTAEVNEKKIFEEALTIPLTELRNRIAEVPVDKPIVVHCAAGYRSAAGSSILAAELANKAAVYDLGETIKDF